MAAAAEACAMEKQKGIEAAEQLQKELDERFLKSFQLFDVDGSGTIDTKEMRNVLHSMGNFDKDELNKMMVTIYKADLDNDGVLDFDEFRRVATDAMVAKTDSGGGLKGLLHGMFEDNPQAALFSGGEVSESQMNLALREILIYMVFLLVFTLTQGQGLSNPSLYQVRGVADSAHCCSD